MTFFWKTIRYFLMVLGLSICVVGCASNSAPPPTPLNIATTELTPAKIGEPYSQQLTATGGVPPYQWKLLSSTVSGVSVNSTGVVNVQATASGNNFSVGVQVTDSAQTVLAISLRNEVVKTN